MSGLHGKLFCAFFFKKDSVTYDCNLCDNQSWMDHVNCSWGSWWFSVRGLCEPKQVCGAEMMCFYTAVFSLCFGTAIKHGLQSTAKRHLLLSASLVVGWDYSQNKVQTGWLIEGSAEVRAAVYFHTQPTLAHFIRMDFYGLILSQKEFVTS